MALQLVVAVAVPAVISSAHSTAASAGQDMTGRSGGRIVMVRVVTISPRSQLAIEGIVQVSVIVPPHMPGYGVNVEVTIPCERHALVPELVKNSVVGLGGTSQVIDSSTGASTNSGDIKPSTMVKVYTHSAVISEPLCIPFPS